MMWSFFIGKKKREKESNKIKGSFRLRDNRLSKIELGVNKIQEDIKELKNEFVSKKEFDVLIKMVQGGVHGEGLRSSRTTRRVKADKLLDKAELMHEISSMLKSGLSTEEIHHNIVNVKGLCKKTCFFKYLKLVRVKGSRTPLTRLTN